MKGLAISSEPSTGLSNVIVGPRSTANPSDRGGTSGSIKIFRGVCRLYNLGKGEVHLGIVLPLRRERGSITGRSLLRCR